MPCTASLSRSLTSDSPLRVDLTFPCVRFANLVHRREVPGRANEMKPLPVRPAHAVIDRLGHRVGLGPDDLGPENPLLAVRSGITIDASGGGAPRPTDEGLL